MAYSSLSAVSGAGTAPAFSNSTPLWMSSVASPPSSTICVGPRPSPKSRARAVKSQYSSSDSPLKAKTGIPRGCSGVPSRADHHRRRGVVLGREDVAGDPAHVGAERVERLDQHRGLDRHVQRAHDALPLERLRRAVLLADGHQAGHLLLGEADLLAPPLGEREVGDAVVELLRGGDGGGHRLFLSLPRRGPGAVRGAALRVPVAISSAGPLAFGSGASGRQRTAARPAAASSDASSAGSKPLRELAHLAPEVVAVVAQQVDHHGAPAGAEDARAARRAARAGSATWVRASSSSAASQRGVLDRQRAEVAPAQLDVGERLRARARGAQHLGRGVDRDRPGRPRARASAVTAPLPQARSATTQSAGRRAAAPRR